MRFSHGPYRGKVGIIESIDIPDIKVMHLVPANTVRLADAPREVIIWTICDVGEIMRLVPEFSEAIK